MRFKRRRGVVHAELDAVEAGVLFSVAGDLLELLGAGEAPDQDPLAAMVGLPSGPVERPHDPALARLLPDAYGDDDAAATDFRRYTEADLRAGKRADAELLRSMVGPLQDRGGRLPLDRAQAGAWLTCLNDLRLVLGTRLGVTEQTEDAELDEDSPRAQALLLYSWLGWLQESLLGALDPELHR